MAADLSSVSGLASSSSSSLSPSPGRDTERRLPRMLLVEGEAAICPTEEELTASDDDKSPSQAAVAAAEVVTAPLAAAVAEAAAEPAFGEAESSPSCATACCTFSEAERAGVVARVAAADEVMAVDDEYVA